MTGRKAAPRKKAFKTRAGTGCSTCRKAHVRCDEEKPVCRRCTRLSLVCGYTKGTVNRNSTAPFSSTAHRPLLPAILPRQGLSHHPNTALNHSDTLYLDFFKSAVVPWLCRQPDGPSGFWSRTLLRECMRDSSVVDAVIGIAALIRARNEKPSSPSSGASDGKLQVPPSKHYSSALRHYTKAIASFRQRIEATTARSPQAMIPPRTLLIFTMLFAVFELMQGNTNAQDQLVSNGLQLFGGRLRPCPAWTDQQYQLTPPHEALDDAEIYDAESFLIRTTTWSAIFSPMYPRSRQVLAAQATLSVSYAGEGLLGSSPPGRIGVSVQDFWQTWWHFITKAVMWHLRVQTILHGVKNDAGNPGMNDGNALPSNSVILAQLEEEQRLLSARTLLWMIETQARLGEISGQLDTSVDQDPAQEAQLRKDRRILTMLALDVKICYLSGCHALDPTGDAWTHPSSVRECTTALDMAHEVVTRLTAGAASPADQNGRYIYEHLVTDGLLIGLLQLARASRDKTVRWRAFRLAKTLVSGTSMSAVKSFVMGTWACLDAEESARDETTGYIRLSERYEWTAASWDESHSVLSVTITSQGLEDGSDERKTKTATLRPETFGFV
ncbi:hypothetical protein Micbo1qcDRAFT_218231 [Microdochium bolleyi]|uniref:Zn(2)-C6 fungal-type domain-containing protein n=1 Tax=Microdochium bolleyi TaxID=196109 RepID=A0A136IQ23_9PEZI|nr:hypothetical protein Micbo1qcDRAFT_218231 [Microdochium bolleyi]